MASHILLVDDDPEVLRMLQRVLAGDGYAVQTAPSAEKALDLARQDSFDVVLSDLSLPNLDGLGLLRALRAEHPDIPFILLTGYGTVETAVQAMKDGAYDYLPKPVERQDLLRVVRRAAEQSALVQELRRLRLASGRLMARDNILGKSKRMQTLFDLLGRVAPSTSTVLIEGESGTGKELFARAIHTESPRHDKPFVPINVAGLPEPLLESELFGHVKGAFTGAAGSKKGLIEEAHGGTLFLDEIGEMSLGMQAKILRVLQEGEIRPVGEIGRASCRERVYVLV